MKLQNTYMVSLSAYQGEWDYILVRGAASEDEAIQRAVEMKGYRAVYKSARKLDEELDLT